MKPLNYYDFLQYFAQPGCLVCNLVERDVAKYLDSLMYEYVNAPITHEAMRASRGLCAQHNSQLADYGASVLGISILQSVILDEVLKISGGASGGSAFARLRGRHAGFDVVTKEGFGDQLATVPSAPIGP